MKIDVPFASTYRLMHPRLTVLVTSIGKGGKPNIITLAWTMPTSFAPPMVAISVAPERHSHGLISESLEFVVSIPTMEITRETLFCGRHSGRECDKFKETGLTPIPAKKVHPPLIKECISHLECKVVNAIETGDHTVFIGEVVSASVNQGVFKDRFNIDEVKPIYHLGGDDFLTLSTDPFNR